MAGPGEIQKPTVFISHAVTDGPIAKILRDEIDKVFAGGTQVFASSVPGVIEPGADWLRDIRTNLETATAVIVIVSPTSLNRPWVWFEVGASWSRMEEGKGRIFPLCVPEVDKGSLPEPLGRLQAMSLGKAGETKEVFKALVDQFGFGKIGSFRHSRIKNQLPRYDELPVSPADLQTGTIYTGPYEGYSAEELALVVEDIIVKPNWDSESHRPGEFDRIFERQLLHFRNLDERYELPPGTAKKFLPKIMTERYPVVIAKETENTIRFALYDWDDYQVWRAEQGYY